MGALQSRLDRSTEGKGLEGKGRGSDKGPITVAKRDLRR